MSTLSRHDDPEEKISGKFAFCVHSHQPAGNSTHILQKVFDLSYGPFFRKLYEHPSISINAHFSGYLLKWMVENRQDYVDMVREMVSRGQAEILGGGMYEPIIPSVPVDDAISQIKDLSDLVWKTFRTRPNGMWLAERVWEPELPMILGESGMEYTLVDDYGFMNAGFPRNMLHGHYTAEYDGHEIAVFPINIRVRDAIPFSGYRRALNLIQSLSQKNGGTMITFGDDCEKFGSWPGTFESVYGRRWLDRFLSGLEERNIRTNLFSDHVRGTGTSGMVYLPTCSYPEMMKWAMSPDEHSLAETVSRQRGMKESQIMVGSPWKNFLSRYTESMQMFRKIRFVSSACGPDCDPLARDFLFQGEANDALWHGVFGGIYLPLLRMKSYSNLIRAQHAAEDGVSGTTYSRQFNNDLMGKKSFCISSGEIWLMGSFADGLEIHEIDLRSRALNLTDTLTKREEAYHRQISRILRSGIRKEGNIGKGLFIKNIGRTTSLSYDSSPRYSFKDRLLDSGTTADDLQSSSRSAARVGKFTLDKVNATSASASFRLENNHSSVQIDKRVSIGETRPEISVSYSMGKSVGFQMDSMLGSEINLSSFACSLRDIEVDGKPLIMGGVESHGESVRLDYRCINLRITIKAEGAGRIWTYPVETVSNSEEGLETILQGLCVMPSIMVRDGGEMKVTILAENVYLGVN